ncbi:hypothetical protein ABPG72_003481 [Tetrahymena utriculariae]
MRSNILQGIGSNTYYQNWKEDKDYEAHIKRLKQINDKQIDVARKYSNLDKLIDYSHKKRELIKDFNRREYIFNLGQENNRIKKRLEEISTSQSKDNKHAQDHNKFSQTLYNNNKIITQRQKNDHNKQLEAQNFQLASRIMNLKSQYPSEQHNTHFQFHLQYKKNVQKFRKRDRSLILSVQSNQLDEYSPNNSVFELVRNTATNSTHLSQVNSPQGISTPNNNSSFVLSQKQTPMKQKRENKFNYQVFLSRPKYINSTQHLDSQKQQKSIDQISEPSKDFTIEKSIDSSVLEEKQQPQRIQSNQGSNKSVSENRKQKDIDEETKKYVLGGRDVFLTARIKKINFKTFIPCEADDDLFYFIINAGENKPNRTQLKSFKKIQSSNYHLAFISDKFQQNEQKVTFQLWQNRNNTNIFLGEFTIDVSQQVENINLDLEVKKSVPRTFVSGRVILNLTVTKMQKTQNNQNIQPISEQQNNQQIDKNGNKASDIEQRQKPSQIQVNTLKNNNQKQPAHSSLH